MIKFAIPKNKQSRAEIGYSDYPKSMFYDQWDKVSRYRIHMWTSRNSDSWITIQGFWLFEPNHQNTLEKVKFTAADPHWVMIPHFLDDDLRTKFTEYLDTHKISWRY